MKIIGKKRSNLKRDGIASNLCSFESMENISKFGHFSYQSKAARGLALLQCYGSLCGEQTSMHQKQKCELCIFLSNFVFCNSFFLRLSPYYQETQHLSLATILFFDSVGHDFVFNSHAEFCLINPSLLPSAKLN